MQQQIETNTINLSTETANAEVIARFNHALRTGTCPLCRNAWNLSKDAMRLHWQQYHPDEYDDYRRARTEMNIGFKIESISANEERLVALLKEGPQTRDQLVRKLHVPRTTIYDGLRKLIERDEVKKFPLFATERSRGRPQVLFSLLDGRT
jgi:hypothetical protein